MTGRLHRLGAIVRADFLIRLRRPSTAVVFLLLSFVPYLWIPKPSTGRALFVMNNQRAIYNSAAIGVATALIGTIFIGMFGFYVISNALKRDVISRVGYVIASTTMRGSEYIAGKFAGNVVFLTVFTLGFMATAMAMVVVRGEAPLEPLVFAKQYLLLLPPVIVFISAVAILFEATPLLRTKFGDVLYFFLWVAMMGVVVSTMEKNPATKDWAGYFDVSGMGFLLQQMKTHYHTDSVSIGASTFDAAKGTIVYSGFRFDWQSFLPRLGATLWPISLLAVARLFFHRFDPARVRAVANEKSHRSWIGRLNFLAKPLARLFVRLATPIIALSGNSSLLRSAMTDALTTIAAFPLAAVAIVGIGIASLFTDVLPIAYAACAIAISDIACREKRAGTTGLVFAAPTLRGRFVWWKLLTTLIVAAAFLAIPITRAILVRPSDAPSLLLGVLFTAAAATALGIVSSNPKTFIVAFLTYWYISLSDKGASPEFDFAGWFGTATPPVVAAYAAATLAFLALAQLFHTHELRKRW